MLSAEFRVWGELPGLREGFLEKMSLELSMETWEESARCGECGGALSQVRGMWGALR